MTTLFDPFRTTAQEKVSFSVSLSDQRCRAHMSGKKISICFFGITRSLETTIGSIKTNILDPLGQDVSVFAHLYNQREINNPRSGEFGTYKEDDPSQLGANELMMEEPSDVRNIPSYVEALSMGDVYEDKGKSLRNLFLQLRSLKAVSNLALAADSDICIFARPDLIYHDSFNEVFDSAYFGDSSFVAVPDWQHWYGLNDRFAVCKGKEAIKAYGQRIDQISNYCRELKKPLQAEGLLDFALRRSELDVQQMSIRASRVRVNGRIVAEDFQPWETAVQRHDLRRATRSNTIFDKIKLRTRLKRMLNRI